jgi:hypothetical protein
MKRTFIRASEFAYRSVVGSLDATGGRPDMTGRPESDANDPTRTSAGRERGGGYHVEEPVSGVLCAFPVAGWNNSA